MKNKLQNQIKELALTLSMFLLTSVTVNAQCPLPGPVAGMTGDGKACPGDSKPYSNGVSQNATSYLWTLPVGCTIAGQNPYSTTGLSVTIDFGVGFTPPGTILVRGVNACGNGNPYSKNVNANPPQTPVKINGNSLACPGDIFNYNVTAVPGITNNWSVPGTMQINSGQGTNSVDIQFLAGFTTSGIISVTATNGCGTSSAKTLQVFKNNPPPTPTSITGSDIACPNDVKTYSVPTYAGVTNYDWEIPAGATISGQGTETVDVTFPSNFVSGNVRCRYQNNCGSSAFQIIQVRATPTIPGLISGPASGVCGCTASYSVAAIQGATNYTWTPPAGATIVSGQGTNNVDISFGATVSGVISVNCSNDCGTSADRTLAVTGNIIITIQPQSTAACQDDNINLSVGVPGCGLSFQWRQDGVNLSDNADFSGTLTSTLSILGVDSIDADSYDVVITSTCAPSVTSNPAILTVNMKPPVPGSVTAPLYACPGDVGVVASVPAGGYNTTSHLWTVSSDATITSGQGTNSITIDFGPTSSSTYKARCWAVNACGISKDTSKHLFQYRVNTPTVNVGPVKVCAGQTNVDYAAPAVINASGYLWTASSGITINSGQGTEAINVDFDLSFVSGQVCLQAFTTCYTSPFDCQNIILDVPNVPGNISGQASGACGSTLTYSINPANGANSYLWTPPAGASIVSGQGTTSVDVDFTSFTGTGNLCVQSVGNCVNSADRCKNLKAAADKPGAITPSTTTFCANQTGNTFSIAPVLGATSYLWTVPGGATVTSGQGTTSVTVDLGVNSGFVRAKSVNACGTSQPSVYTINITCRLAGDDVDVNYTSLEVYPNPASENIYISFDAMNTETYSFEITDVSGRVVMSEVKMLEAGLHDLNFDLSTITPGLYFMSVKSTAGVEQVRFVKE